MGLFSTVPGCMWQYLALLDGARLYLAVPGSALVCHDLPFHRMPHSANDSPKCFCIYRLKCSKAIIGIWIGLDGPLKAPLIWAPLCGTNKKNILSADLLQEKRIWCIQCRILPIRRFSGSFYVMTIFAKDSLTIFWGYSLRGLLCYESCQFVFSSSSFYDNAPPQSKQVLFLN